MPTSILSTILQERMEIKMNKTFDDLIAGLSGKPMKKVAVAVAQDSAVLEAVQAARERGIANAILVGDEMKIKEVADSLRININDFELIHVEDDYEAALTAVKLVHDGQADVLGVSDTSTAKSSGNSFLKISKRYFAKCSAVGLRGRISFKCLWSRCVSM